jgi:hypothetical protein
MYALPPGDVLLAMAEHGGDDILLHAIFAGASGGGVAKVVEPGISLDTGGGEDALIFA